MDILLILLASLSAACLGCRLAARGPITLADFVTGLLGAAISLSITRSLSMAGVEPGLGLALLIACGLALGLGSLQRRPIVG